MKLKFFENELISDQIHKFYDDLATKYLKSTYTYGKEEVGPIKSEKIGRYLLTQVEIYSIEPNIELGFLVYCEEGFLKQDEIVLYYDKYVIAKELKEIFEKYSGKIFELKDMTYVEEVINVEVKDKKNFITVTPAGILIASHIFGVRKIKKFFDREAIYCKNLIPISDYIDSKNYDVSDITNFVKEKKVIPDVNDKDDVQINIGDEFIGQKSSDLKTQLKELLPILQKFFENKKGQKEKKVIADINDKDDTKTNTINQKNSDLKTQLKELVSTLKKFDENKKEKNNDDKNLINFQDSKDEILKKIKNLTNHNNGGKNHRIVEEDEKTLKILKDKFNKDYGEKKYAKYFEDVTNSKIDPKEKKVFNEILRSVDKNNNRIVNQENFDRYRNIYRKNMNVVDFLYDICSNANDPLEALENALCFLSCKYENEGKLQHLGIIAKNIFKSNVRHFIEEKIEKYAKVNLEDMNPNYLTKMGLADVDDIKLYCKPMKLKEYPKTKYYRFLKLFKDEMLISKSYSINKEGKRIFKRSRRFLDNMLICMIKSMTKTENKFFDDYGDDRKNILRNYIIYLDELQNGLEYLDYSFFTSIKPFNITNMVIALIKSNKNYKEKSLTKISDLMQEMTYYKYTKKREDEKIKMCFPTKNSLEYNMRLRSSYNIYNFYSCIYEKSTENGKEKIVCDGATINCSFGQGVSKIIVTGGKKYINGKICLTVEDKNIEPFKTCSINKICTPKLLKWEKKSNISIDDKAVLMSNSKCMCSLGGIITIKDANQSSSNLKEIDKIDTKLRYSLDDYKLIDDSYEILKKIYFNKISRYIFSLEPYILSIEKNVINILNVRLKPNYDEKKLISNEVIPAVDNEIEAIINVKPLSLILMGYFLGRIQDKRYSGKFINIGKSLSKETRFDNFIKKAKKYLPVLYAPYKKSNTSKSSPYWMQKVYDEYFKKYSNDLLKDKVCMYHRLGGGINADITTPWCASFVNYILNLGFKSASSQCFYTEKGKNFFKKIKNAKYGAILVLKYSKNKGHCTFIISENDKGYYCIGGNQKNQIKKSYFPKNGKIQGIYWPL